MSEQGQERDAYVLFTLADATYALPTGVIQQLDMVGAVTPVPNALPYVDGIVSVRGQVVPAVDLRTRFGLPRAERTLRSRLLVLRIRERTLALIVDAAREFARIAPESVLEPPEAMGGRSRRWLRGVAQLGERLVLVLDAERLIEDEDTVPAHASAAGA